MTNPTTGQRVSITDTSLVGTIVALCDIGHQQFVVIALDEGFYGFANEKQIAYVTKYLVHPENLQLLKEMLP